MKTSMASITSALDLARERIAALETEIARVTTTLEQERQAHQDRLNIYQSAEDQFKAAVKATAADALTANNEAFLTLAQEKLGAMQHLATADFEQKQKAIQEIVAPVATLLDKLQSDVKAAEQNRIETRTEIIGHVRQVAELVWEVPCAECGALPEGAITRMGHEEVEFRCPKGKCELSKLRGRTILLDPKLVEQTTSLWGKPLSEVIQDALKQYRKEPSQTVLSASTRKRPFTIRIPLSQHYFFSDRDIEAALVATIRGRNSE
jgi:lipid II:glycine glycyltransferase (peptidoglycan interpeptide bridge formation enzyme)